MEKDSNELGILFQQIVSDIKSSFPLWEDFTNKAVKLHSALRSTVSASTGFLDAFQKLADCASGTRGATADIGSSLTRLCLRHKAIENRLKNYTISLMDALVVPLQDRMDDWKKSVVQMEKDRAKEYKKCHSELKKASGETCRLQKKVNKGRADIRGQLEEATTELNSRFAALEASEKNSVTLALTEQRSHLCHLISCVKPLVDQEIAMVSEAEHLKEIIENMSRLATKPPSLALSSEEVLADVTRCLQLQSTIERKKRILKDDAECESMSNSSGSNNASLDGLNLCTGSTSVSSAAQSAQPAQLHTSISVDNPQSFSYGNLLVKTRQSYSSDTRNSASSYSTTRQGAVTAMSKPENPYAVPTTQPSQSWSNTVKVVDKIYARPALVMNKENGSTLKRVMTPTVPSLAQADESNKVKDFPVSGYITKNDLAGLAKLREMSEDSEKKNVMESQHSTTSRKADFTIDAAEMSLADALRELEASTAMLQVPYEASSAQSCQSLQCSSGYGTLTNVSSNSAETVASFPADLDALAKALLASSCDFPDLDKCSTLPSKRQMHEALQPSLRRPASTAGIESVTTGTNKPAQKEETFQSTGSLNCNSSISAASASCVSRPLLPSHSSFPPASAFALHHPLLTMHIPEDDMDDLPLPPPPEDIDACPLPFQTSRESQGLSMHASVMQSLNEKLSMRNSGGVQTPANLQRSASVKQNIVPSHQAVLRSTQRDTETAAEDGTPDPNSFEHLIRRGVKLRHTISNDRSAPRVIKH